MKRYLVGLGVGLGVLAIISMAIIPIWRYFYICNQQPIIENAYFVETWVASKLPSSFPYYPYNGFWVTTSNIDKDGNLVITSYRNPKFIGGYETITEQVVLPIGTYIIIK